MVTTTTTTPITSVEASAIATAQDRVNAQRAALFARQGAGESVPQSEWDVVAAAQRAVDDVVFDSRGMFRTRVY